MKNIHVLKLSITSFLCWFILIFPGFSHPALSAASLDTMPLEIPKELVLQEDGPQKYSVMTNIRTRKSDGGLINHIQLTGDFTRGLENNCVRWNNVKMAARQDAAQPLPPGQPLAFMENFSYNNFDSITSEAFFKNMPQGEILHLVKSLVWDAVSVEFYGWTFWDKLELNHPIQPAEFEDFNVQIGNWGAMKMKGLNVTWTGISERNGENCAVIHYQSLCNPVEATQENPIVGRSLYWGLVWVSLVDKQIEYATLNEDLIFEITMPGGADKMLMNMQREFLFDKVE